MPELITGYLEDEQTTPAKASPTSYLVAVYNCEQCYGGPEEGGWWYDSGELVRVTRVFRSYERASSYCYRLNERLNSRSIGPNAGKRSYTSVLSDGEYRARVEEDTAPKRFPAERPYYC